MRTRNEEDLLAELELKEALEDMKLKISVDEMGNTFLILILVMIFVLLGMSVLLIKQESQERSTPTATTTESTIERQSE